MGISISTTVTQMRPRPDRPGKFRGDDANLALVNWRARNPIRSIAIGMVANAKKRCLERGIPFEEEALSIDYIERLINDTTYCPCCGVELDTRANRARVPNAASLDKVIQERGYTILNVEIICWRCNSKKSDMTADELRRIADYIDRHA